MASPMAVKNRIAESVNVYELTGDARVLSPGEKGLIVSILNRYVGGDDNRHLVLSWLFSKEKLSPMSTHELSTAQGRSLFDWMNPEKIDGSWLPATQFQVEIVGILDEAVKEYYKGIDRKTRAEFPIHAEEPLMLVDALGGLEGKLLAITDETPGNVVSNEDLGIPELELEKPKQTKAVARSSGVARPIRPVRPKGVNPFG